MAEAGYSAALRVLRQDAAGGLHQVLAEAAERIPARDLVVYLADFGGQVLLPLAPGAGAEDVAGTLAGRAFTAGQPVTSQGDGAVRVWVPVLMQTTRIGVLAATVPHAGPGILEQAALLGVFAGLVVAATSRFSDIPHVRRRDRAMSLPAGMQWDLLPPPGARTPGALIAGILEPAYDVAGDAFDYAFCDDGLHFAIIDGMGHGIRSTQLTGLAVGAYRHARRHGATLLGAHAGMDHALAHCYDDLSFATGVIGTLTISTGRLEWSCAGHPPPLLLRNRKVVAELAGEPALPFGLGGGAPALHARDLEPGDTVLLYTDGVTEARTPEGELFGKDRLADLAEREAASERPPDELIRRLVQAVLAHQAGSLRDDATLLLVQWAGTPEDGVT